MAKCKKCGKKEARKKGLCTSCYNKWYYQHHKEELKKRAKERYHEKKAKTCPLCGGRKEEGNKVCEQCRKDWKETVDAIWGED